MIFWFIWLAIVSLFAAPAAEAGNSTIRGGMIETSSQPLAFILGQGLESIVSVDPGSIQIVFDDFDDWVSATSCNGVTIGDLANSALGPIWDQVGWQLTQIGTESATTPHVGMNWSDSGTTFSSSIRFFMGTQVDAGCSAQLDQENFVHKHSGDASFPHMYIPDEDSVIKDVMDDRVFVFGFRVGFREDVPAGGTDGDGDWSHKVFIGFIGDTDTQVLDVSTGLITQPETTGLVGFHVLEDGSVRGVSQRTVNTAYAEGTNFTELLAAGGVDGTIANGALIDGGTLFFDFIVKIDITDSDNDSDNGTTSFWYRKIIPGTTSQPSFTAHPTTLSNQFPQEADPQDLVPHIEFIHGPNAGRDGGIWLSWWAFGQTVIDFTSGIR